MSHVLAADSRRRRWAAKVAAQAAKAAKDGDRKYEARDVL
jgi:hypothetical protein